MVDAVRELESGREAYAKRAWLDAYTDLSNADRAGRLGAEDLELLAMSASMVGHMDELLVHLERAHDANVDAGESLRAARCAFWLGMNLALRGEVGSAGGWFGRAERLVEREGRECVEQGYLLLPVALQGEQRGDFESAYAAAGDAAAIGERFGDADLFSIAVHVQGLARISQARVAEGLRLLDEAMMAVTAGKVSPLFTGIVYCGVIAGCEAAYDPRRAHEWTNALARWCEEQPQMVAFSGRCLAHRAGIMQLHGEWRDALSEAQLARERCEAAMNGAAAGQALYQQGEIHRLQGDFAAAEAAYRDASRFGREAQPGLALLRLGQGDDDAAAAAIRRLIGETSQPMSRAAILPAYVEIMLAVGDAKAASDASSELAEISATSESEMLRTIAASVEGTVELSAGDARDALVMLRRAWQGWQELDAPYEAARVRVLLGLACRSLGDEDSALLELDAARGVFQELGASPDLDRLDSLVGTAREGSHGLSDRELQVLRLVAAGRTNREIAAELVLSHHTVARHVQNIFAKLDVSSRTAATAFAFEHDIV